jgi:molybdenum cofactor synthesis domain-containing protein
MLFGVLTISDRCSQGLLEDTAGPAVAALLKQEWKDAEIFAALLADDQEAIEATLKRLVDDAAALVLTVGGTGLGPRDCTPEATRRGHALSWRATQSIRLAVARSCRAERIHADRQFAGQRAWR